MNFLELLAESADTQAAFARFQEAFNPLLKGFLERQTERVRDRLPALAERSLEDYLASYSLRGGAKRVRPLLFCCGYLALGGQEVEKALRASISVELLQSALLIHDDIIDRSDQRRRGKTMHRLWEDYFRNQGFAPRYADDRSHFGASMGILLGDLACALAYDALLEPAFPRERQLEAVRTFTDVIRRVAFGELLDVELSLRPLERVDEAEILKVYELKTSVYTTEGPLEIGAVLAGGKAKARALLSAYAVPLGIAFQLQDDVLGMFGSPRDTGKDEASDLAEGKRTLLLLRAWQAGREDPSWARLLEEALARPERAADYLPQVRRILVDSGALASCRRLIEAQLAQVKAALARIESALGALPARALGQLATSIEQRADYQSAVSVHG